MPWAGIARLLSVGGSSCVGPPLSPPARVLTCRPIHLLTGFMRKEEKKPLRYITSGMVAMNFCRAERARARQEGRSGWRCCPAPPRPAPLTLGRLRE